mgnify:CR=1 FL=1|tara:strand:+ start:2420 stop:2623 length:204 start_codon:yes stop_codon:yes gene_type:complete
MTSYTPHLKFHTKVERRFIEIRGVLAKQMRDKNYSVKQIAKSLRTNEQNIYDDLKKIKTKEYRNAKI